MEPLESVLEFPASKRLRQQHAGADALPLLDIEEVPSDTMFLHIVWPHISRKKTVPIAPRAGGRLQASDVAVSVLAPLKDASEGADPHAVISLLRGYRQHSRGSNFIMSGFHGAVADIRKNVFLWRRQDFEWSIRQQEAIGVSHDDFAVLLRRMVNTSAIECNRETLGYAPLPGEVAILVALQRHGLARHVARVADRWVLTEQGVQDMCHCFRLREPYSLFEVRQQLPLQDRSMFELIVGLTEQGWQWRCWRPRSSRARTGPQISEGYRNGGG